MWFAYGYLCSSKVLKLTPAPISRTLRASDAALSITVCQTSYSPEKATVGFRVAGKHSNRKWKFGDGMIVPRIGTDGIWD